MMTTTSPPGVGRSRALGATIALAIGALVAADAATPHTAHAAQTAPSGLPIQLSTTTGSTLIRSLTVPADARITYTMGAGLYTSETRLVVYLDGKYMSETYGGRAYNSAAVTSDGVTTVTVPVRVKLGQKVSIVLAEGRPGEAHSNDRVLASTRGGDVSDVAIASDGRLTFTMSEAKFTSDDRVVVWLDGKYLAETHGGKAFYAKASRANGQAMISIGKTIAPGQTIEIGVAPGKPGQPLVRADSRIMATVGATTASQVLTDQVTSTLTIGSRGDAEADRIRENRWYRHSVLEPAGRYVTAGQKIEISLPSDATGVKVAIGQYGVHSGVNDRKDVGVKLTDVAGGTRTVVADRDGLVSLVKTTTGAVSAKVTGGVPVPTFTLGQTTSADFAIQAEKFETSPFVVVGGERVVSMLQRSTIASLLPSVTDERVRSWDRAVEIIDAEYGLDTAATGTHHKSPGRILIANPDENGANNGYAYATHDRVIFPNIFGAGADLFTKPITDQWGLWHEIGHTYQAPQNRWTGMGEVTVNIASLAVQRALGVQSSLETGRNPSSIRAYLAQPDASRVYDAQTDYFVKLAMLDGLRVIAGDHFYPQLNQNYRENLAQANSAKTDDAKAQYFMVMAGSVAGANLADYFTKWGMKPNASTQAALATFPTP
ncbi:M60 family metallopeptidase [Leifsonia sp. McL0607]|uniref:M60 family metallopeptidase n=1 Tax=Leifsonia sp. McL0607 TaxID=3415672 RepID=UPI003CF0AA1F